MIILLVLGQLKHLVVEHTYCEGEVPIPGQQTKPVNMEGTPDVVMLGASWCPSCITAIQFFAANDINYCEYDMENTQTGIQLYNDNGGGAVPLLMIGNSILRGFNPELIETVLSETKEMNNKQI